MVVNHSNGSHSIRDHLREISKITFCGKKKDETLILQSPKTAVVVNWPLLVIAILNIHDKFQRPYVLHLFCPVINFSVGVTI